MKKHSLSAAVIGALWAAAIPTVGVAVNLNPRGLGQALVFPYYTVSGGHQTLLSVVNTTAEAKALKVRFLEGLNGRDALTFNVYLGAYDAWTGAVFQLSDSGPANLTTSDLSCTVPAIRTSTSLPRLPNNGPTYQPFRNQAFSGSAADAGTNALWRTREGSIEIIEMGTLQANSASARAVAWGPNGSSSQEPADCAGLVAAWSPSTGYWAQNPSTDIAAPGGGLFGSAALIDVSIGTLITYAPDALDGFRSNALHTEPGASRPSLGDALSDGANDIATAFVNANGTTLRSDYRASSNGVDAVSAVFMAESLWNEYTVELGVGGQSEWVITLPTKRYYTDPALATGTAAIAPFKARFANGGACSEVFRRSYDRNMRGAIEFDFTPPPAGLYTSLCFHSNVMDFTNLPNFSGPTSLLGSMLRYRYPIEFDSGWTRLYLDDPIGLHSLRPALDGDIYRGLPVTGFWAVNYINSNAAPGLLANYGSAAPHRTTSVCHNAAGACS